MKKFISLIKHPILLLRTAVNSFLCSFSQSLILNGKLDLNRNKPLRVVMVVVNLAVSRKRD